MHSRLFAIPKKRVTKYIKFFKVLGRDIQGKRLTNLIYFGSAVHLDYINLGPQREIKSGDHLCISVLIFSRSGSKLHFRYITTLTGN